MRLRRLTGLALTALASGAAVAVGSHPATAATSSTLYVYGASSACTDAGPGTLAQPFCTIAAGMAAVQNGQVLALVGTYPDHITINRSGVPGAPFTISGGVLSGSNAGITIDGQHDVTVNNMRVYSTADSPPVLVRNSTAINLFALAVGSTATTSQPAVALSGVTDTTLTSVGAHGSATGEGIALDAATSGVTISRGVASAGSPGTTAIDISGSHNTVSGTGVNGGTTAGIVLEPGASDNTIANARIDSGPGMGIHNDGATGTAIANVEVKNGCGRGIVVGGASSGVSVQNNVVTDNGVASATCTPAADAVDIGVYGAAVGHTTVDYNVVHEAPGPSDYAWAGTSMTLAQFRSASGQGAHDVDSTAVTAVVDSANSAAPGYPARDWQLQARIDDPNVPDTGAGPVTVADRGPSELGAGPQPNLRVTTGPGLYVVADATLTTGSYSPIAALTVDFGDATSETLGPGATFTFQHVYSKVGLYTLTLTATDGNGLAASTTATASLQTEQQVSLLAVANDRFVTAPSGGTAPMIANSPVADAWGYLGIIDRGDGYVMLQSLTAAQDYVTVDASRGGQLLLEPYTLDSNPPDSVRFQLIRNTDGSVSFKAKANGEYVTAESGGAAPLVANRTAIGPWEQFHLANPDLTQRALLAHADAKWVTAESAGAKPLIANRVAVGPWEQFTLVDAGGGYVALYSRADNKFVTAEAGGAQPLIANRTAIGPWEKFTFTQNPDGSWSLRAFANGRLVTAEGGGRQSLIANRTAVGPWEEFDLG